MKLRQQSGVALLESLIAILLLSIGVIGTMGLQARTVTLMADAAMRAEATIAGERLIAQLFNDQENLAAYAATAGGPPPPKLAPWLVETRRMIPSANVALAVTAESALHKASLVEITISWSHRGLTDQHRVSAQIASSQ